jgi:hypothetical protein
VSFFPEGPEVASPPGSILDDVGVFSNDVGVPHPSCAQDLARSFCSLSACAIGLRRVPPRVLIVPRPFPAKAVPKAKCTSITTPTIAWGISVSGISVSDHILPQNSGDTIFICSPLAHRIEKGVPGSQIRANWWALARSDRGWAEPRGSVCRGGKQANPVRLWRGMLVAWSRRGSMSSRRFPASTMRIGPRRTSWRDGSGRGSDGTQPMSAMSWSRARQCLTSWPKADRIGVRTAWHW